jgi:hypothetical protein
MAFQDAFHLESVGTDVHGRVVIPPLSFQHRPFTSVGYTLLGGKHECAGASRIPVMTIACHTAESDNHYGCKRTTCRISHIETQKCILNPLPSHIISLIDHGDLFATCWGWDCPQHQQVSFEEEKEAHTKERQGETRKDSKIDWQPISVTETEAEDKNRGVRTEYSISKRV